MVTSGKGVGEYKVPATSSVSRKPVTTRHIIIGNSFGMYTYKHDVLNNAEPFIRLTYCITGVCNLVDGVYIPYIYIPFFRFYLQVLFLAPINLLTTR